MESPKEFIQRKKSKDLLENKLIKLKAIEGGGIKNIWVREKRTLMPQTNHYGKVFTFERLRFIEATGKKTDREKVGRIEYRIGYYIIGHKGKSRNKWTWGQFCPMIPQKDFNKLVSLAKKERVLL